MLNIVMYNNCLIKSYLIRMQLRINDHHVMTDNHGETALHKAASNNCKEVAKLLISNDSNINKSHNFLIALCKY